MPYVSGEEYQPSRYCNRYNLQVGMRERRAGLLDLCPDAPIDLRRFLIKGQHGNAGENPGQPLARDEAFRIFTELPLKVVEFEDGFPGIKIEDA